MRADQGKKYIRDLFIGLNNLMDEWDDKGVTSNNLNLFRDKLEDFYDRNNLNVKNTDRFSWQKGMTEDQAEELYNLAYQMGTDPYSDMSTYEDLLDEDFTDLGTQTTYDSINLDAFQKISEQYSDINTFQDYVDFIDRMNNFKSNALLSSILDSNQVAELYALGSWQNLSDEDVNNIIAFEYSMSGKTGDKLYNTILEAIDLYDEEDYQF